MRFCINWLLILLVLLVLLPPVMAADNEEFKVKVDRARRFFLQEGLTGLILADPANVSWMLGGDVPDSGFPPGSGAPAFLVADKKVYLVATDPELQNLTSRQAKSLVVGSISLYWTEALANRGLFLEAQRLCPRVVGTDTMPLAAPPLSLIERRLLYGDKAEEKKEADPVTDRLRLLGSKMRNLRLPYLPQEIERYRALGRQLAQVCETVARQVQPGQSDFEIAALASRELIRQQLQPVEIRIALDESAVNFSTVSLRGDTLAQFAQISLTARKAGLHASVSRLVHFGAVPDKLARRQDGVTKTMAGLVEALKTGQKVAEVIKPIPPPGGKEKLSKAWQGLPLGWATGYQAKEFILSARGEEFVDEGLVCVLLPQLEGGRLEETVRLEASGFEILTPPGADWPVLELTVRGKPLRLPGILVR